MSKADDESGPERHDATTDSGDTAKSGGDGEAESNERDADDLQGSLDETGDESKDTGDSLDAESIRQLVQESSRLADDAPDLVAGFQRKLRARSRGKFYADGWSTSKEPPIMTYLITSLLMLAMVFAAYAVMQPLAGEAVQVPMTPAPVQLIAPRNAGQGSQRAP